MPHTTESYAMTEDEFVDSIADGDYIFVMDSKGNLKSMLLPEELEMAPIPENVQKVMDIYGITEFHNETVH